MASPAFPTGAQPPTCAELREQVGPAWDLVQGSVDHIGRIQLNWAFSKTSGWHLTLDRSGKRLCYLFPRVGGFLLKIVYNAKGVHALKAAQLQTERLAQARTYAEGTLLEFLANELDGALLTDLLRNKVASMR